MAKNYLITGYWGEPHVTAENDRGIHAAAFGTGRFVLPVGRQFEAEYIGNNTIRMYDGKLMNNGAAAGIPAGEYVDLLISTAGQGMKRNDLIVFQYLQDTSTLIESGTFIVVKGTETSGTPTDPTLTQNDLLTGNATLDQMALWRVTVSGTDIADPVRVSPVVWNNPPMVAGVEYATAEFYNGNRVCTKLVDLGTWTPDKSIDLPDIDCSGGIVRFEAKAGSTPLPYFQTDGFSAPYTAYVIVTRQNNCPRVSMKGGSSTQGAAYITLWYCKA